ncbi:hypothetical protein [Polaromonas naphthalenivorans]|uniref:hypothetical protein n=1 Tax=Polaromonas naphthalenivorans TaxID=216465 RepID=UPI0018DE7955|nr:hypothetical protein [Polaromonas naphthalenivorans]
MCHRDYRPPGIKKWLLGPFWWRLELLGLVLGKAFAYPPKNKLYEEKGQHQSYSE